MIVSPFVFVWPDAEAPALVPSAEVAATRWVALAHLAHPASRAERPWRFLGVTWPAPAWRVDDDLVWGLTHRMLSRLLALVPR